MSNEIEEKIGEKAYYINEEITTLVRNIRSNYITLAELLYKMKTENLWQYLSYESFWAYVGSPEISLKRSTVYKLLGIYEKFVLEEKVSHDRLAGVDYNKLDMVRTKVEGDAEEWIEKAKELSRSDLRGEIDGKEYYPREYCPFCFKKVTKLLTKEEIDEPVQLE